MKAPRFRINNPALQKIFDRYSDFLDNLPKQKKIVAGENMRKAESADEIILHGSAEGVGGGGTVAQCECPWEVAFEAEEGSDPQTFKFVVKYGRVNNQTTEETEITTGIDPTEENPTEQYVILTATFSSAGGVSNIQWSEEGSLPEAEDPSSDFPTEGKIVLGVRQGMRFTRIWGCHNALMYPISLYQVDGTQRFTYEVISA